MKSILRSLSVSSICLAVLAVTGAPLQAATAGKDGDSRLLLAEQGSARARIQIAGAATPAERAAAVDLQKYMRLMTGSEPSIIESSATEGTAPSDQPSIIIGSEALTRRPDLQTKLDAVAKKNATFRADAIVLQRVGNHVYLAGANERSHHFAVAELLRLWGVRWFMPGPMGESVPEETTLEVGDLDIAYAPPFEVRTFWVSWLGGNQGVPEFQLRNMMTPRAELPSTGHILGKHLKAAGLDPQSFPMSAPDTAARIASQVEKDFAAGKKFSLGIEDQIYGQVAPEDQELSRLQWDKYMLRWSITDAMMELYNNVARTLQEKYPASKAMIGFLAYSNMTLPPVRDMKAERSLYAELAPIDIDPIHGMDDPRSPPRQEFKDIMYRWAKVMDGRVAIYDYDQGMLVWRDMPNPSHMAFRQDVQHYRKAGILGVNTESRMALATTFTNLYMRARLLWNPDEDVEALLDDFYTRFYGPAAAPMKAYWTAINDAWEQSIVTEHESFAAPAIYTRALLDRLAPLLQEAEKLVSARVDDSRNGKLFRERMQFTRLSYTVMDGYVAMTDAAATQVDYAAAVAHGQRAMTARDALTAMSPLFTTTRLENGHAWWPGEVKQYEQLARFTNGEAGTLIAKLPLEWAFKRDPLMQGAHFGVHTEPVDLTYWKANGARYDADALKDYPKDTWEMLRTNLYVQAQGVRAPDGQSFTGEMWYRTNVTLAPGDVARNPRIRFPGLFNTCQLFVNGKPVAVREQQPLWWNNDYRFEWDVEMSGAREGENELGLNCAVMHHFGGMFRRPFVYAPVSAGAATP